MTETRLLRGEGWRSITVEPVCASLRLESGPVGDVLAFSGTGPAKYGSAER